MNQSYRNLNTRPALTAILGLAGLVLAAGGPAKADVFNVTYEAPGIQSANATALCAKAGTGTCTVGVESFDTRTNNAAFSTNFGTGGVITGSYSATQINAADQYGGAGGTGKYAVAFGTTPFSVALSTTLKTGLNYFGFWLSALDSGNQVGFYKSNVLLYAFTPTKLITDLGACTNGNKYCGNPTAQFINQNNQQYAFVNFFDTNGTFDSIRFTENPSNGGYESDNHTVGFVTTQTGTGVDVTEPASLAVLGIGLAGLAMLRRRSE